MAELDHRASGRWHSLDSVHSRDTAPKNGSHQLQHGSPFYFLPLQGLCQFHGLPQVPLSLVLLQWRGWRQGLGRGEGLRGQSRVWSPGCQGGGRDFTVQGFRVLGRSWRL